MATDKQIQALTDKLNATGPRLREWDRYFAGEQPAAYMSEKSQAALGDRLKRLSVNFPRLAVTSLAERLDVKGFHLSGDGESDAGLWTIWKRNRMPDGAAMAHLDALVYGRSFVTVWADTAGRPTISVESPLNMAVLTDPLTHRVTVALKRWTDADGTARAAVYEPDRVTLMTAGATADPTMIPTTGWKVTETVDNPLGVVPVVPIVNRARLHDADGSSEMRDLVGLTDALNKIMADAMVTSEFYARPRRWVTGLEIQEDEDGNPVNPFTDTGERIMQSEDPETRFGQFDGSRLDGYSDLAALVTQQIGALAGLPPHYLGLNGDQPPSADSIRSAEASLVSRAYDLQRMFGTCWADVMALVVAVRDGVDPLSVDLETDWASPETRTTAQDADSAVKLANLGVPLRILLEDTLGWPSERVTSAVQEARTNALIQGAAGRQVQP